MTYVRIGKRREEHVTKVKNQGGNWVINAVNNLKDEGRGRTDRPKFPKREASGRGLREILKGRNF